MTLKENKHSKHTALVRPAYGQFGRNEWAISGAPCDIIKALAQQVIFALSPAATIAYVDAEHSNEIPDKTNVTVAANLVYTAKEGQHQLNYARPLNNFQTRPLFNNCGMILINGNHHQGKKQVVVIDSNKKTSLFKRISQLTDVRLFLLSNGETDLFDFIKDAIPNYQQIPVYHLNEAEKIIKFFRNELIESKPEICGLVLAGGKSQRMGQDKGNINWHGKDQRYHMADMLKNYTDNVYISCRTDQQQDINPAYQTLSDTFTGLGPFGAILSAFREQPEKAWLVVACDMPLLDKETLDLLIANRDIFTIATAFESTQSNFPEPLITIWEPKSYSILLSFLSQGYSCPRKVLINSDTNIIQVPNPDTLTNVNTPEELERVKKALQQKTVTA